MNTPPMVIDIKVERRHVREYRAHDLRRAAGRYLDEIERLNAEVERLKSPGVSSLMETFERAQERDRDRFRL